jgi:hypothetical protein
MRKAFTAVATLVMLAIAAQFFLAASGAFDTAPNEEAFRPHRSLGFLTIILALVLTLVAALARMPGRIIGLSALLAGLGILQPVIAAIARAFGDSGNPSTVGQLVFGLHAMNALAMVSVYRHLMAPMRGKDGAGRDVPAARSAS